MIEKYDAANDNFKGVTLNEVDYKEVKNNQSERTFFSQTLENVKQYSRFVTKVICANIDCQRKDRQYQNKILERAGQHGAEIDDIEDYILTRDMIQKTENLINYYRRTLSILESSLIFFVKNPMEIVANKVNSIIFERGEGSVKYYDDIFKTDDDLSEFHERYIKKRSA